MRPRNFCSASALRSGFRRGPRALPPTAHQARPTSNGFPPRVVLPKEAPEETCGCRREASSRDFRSANRGWRKRRGTQPRHARSRKGSLRSDGSLSRDRPEGSARGPSNHSESPTMWGVNAAETFPERGQSRFAEPPDQGTDPRRNSMSGSSEQLRADGNSRSRREGSRTP